MRTTQMLEERRADEATAASPDVAHRTTDNPANGIPATDAHATVLPAPLTTTVAALMGGLIGLGAIYGVASRLAGTLTAVAAIVMVFAVTLAGPRVHAAARTDVGRTVAVVLQAIGFGGVIGALIILV